MSCNKHTEADLIVILSAPDLSLSNAEDVVRWCPSCGAIVVDKDVDNHTYAGRGMKMKTPILAQQARLKEGKS
jgi:hypothetical protein